MGSTSSFLKSLIITLRSTESKARIIFKDGVSLHTFQSLCHFMAEQLAWVKHGPVWKEACLLRLS
jgi:hypothetical protein